MTEPIIKLRDLSYSVSGKEILKNINLDIFAREIFTVVGLSGSGKSTLLRLICGLLHPTSGEIEVLGIKFTPKMPKDEYIKLLKEVGFVFQYGALFDSLTVRENVGFSLYEHTKLSDSEIKHKIAETLKAVGMSNTEKLYPDELSGGMQKRIGIARSLIQEPKILLYDEPNSGLDPIISATIDDLIMSLKESRGVTAVVVTHDIKSVMTISNRVAFLYNHALEFVGSPNEIKSSNSSALHQFLNGQTEGPIKVK